MHAGHRQVLLLFKRAVRAQPLLRMTATASFILHSRRRGQLQGPFFEKRRRVKHWDNAVSQGQHCARLLMGERQPFRHVPYFFSDEFDLSYEFWGDTSGAENVVTRGDIMTKSFSVWWLSGQHLIAAFVMNRPDDERTAAPQWIESKRPVDVRELQDISHELV